MTCPVYASAELVAYTGLTSHFLQGSRTKRSYLSGQVYGMKLSCTLSIFIGFIDQNTRDQIHRVIIIYEEEKIYILISELSYLSKDIIVGVKGKDRGLKRS